MMVIGICEGKRNNADRLKKIIEKYCSQTNRIVSLFFES